MGCERNVFVILYSLLCRHYDIMRVGQKVYVHPEELTEAAASVVLLSDAFMFRAQDLAGLFIQRRLSVDVEMEDFACGMFWGVHKNQDASGFMPDTVTLDLAQAGDVLDPETDSDGVSETILRYPPFCEDFYPQSDDRIQECGTDVRDALKPLLGVWGGIASVTRRIVGNERKIDIDPSGFPSTYQQPESPETYRATFSYHFHPSPTDPNKLIAEPVNPRTYSYTRLTVTMECAGSETDTGPRIYRMTESWNSSTFLNAEYELLLHEDGITLSGGLKNAYSPSSPTVIMKKGSPPEVMMFYPFPADIQGSRAKALWRFALDAVLYDVKRRAFSWNFIKERRDVRARYVSLLRALISNVPLPYEDFRELELLYGRIPPADLHFYTHVAMEPERYPSRWILPRCRACSRILRPDAARLCCYSCLTFDQGLDVDRLDISVFDCEECALNHGAEFQGTCYLFFEFWDAGWTLATFTEKTGLTKDQLEAHFHTAKQAVSDVNIHLRQDSPDVWAADERPSSLSTITEVAEDIFEDVVPDTPIPLQVSGDTTAATEQGSLAHASSVDGEVESQIIQVPGNTILDRSSSSNTGRNTDETSEHAFDLSSGSPVGIESSMPFFNERERTSERPRCIGCGSQVQLPCRICLECPVGTLAEPLYICDVCQPQDAIQHAQHKKKHTLLLVWDGPVPRRSPFIPPVPLPESPLAVAVPRFASPPVAEDADADWYPRRTADPRLDTIASRCERIEVRMDGFESRLSGMDDRLRRVDETLAAVLSLLQRNLTRSGEQ
ncbi:hypothetical protein NUW54_g3181 [Trametes sanguinea]|uniref:Uncharacterized protein n=1 Tax=Trametes sanguinea TaxID=158606 RepID=A0ACC1Q345_9APHY|nr:hypothetical protein NUW54_g3181 [Trametes sanguinea]